MLASAALNPGMGNSQEPAAPVPTAAPSLSLPKGGGAIRGIGEKFAANPVTGTGTFTVPIFTSPGRSGFGPQLSLSYDSGAGNGPFGFGWHLALPAITRKTAKGLPLYRDDTESDVFLLSGAEDLVPAGDSTRAVGAVIYLVRAYRPRVEGAFARIERWTDAARGDTFWRSISKDNVTTLYGRSSEARIADPHDPRRIFSWLICESYDDRGNAILYEYAAETSYGVARASLHERNRDDAGRSANRYLKRIKYGNRTPRRPGEDLGLRADWLFETVFDYDEGHCETVAPDAEPRHVRAAIDGARDGANGARWGARPDPFSTYSAGFEVRTYRRCHRVLMFHRFAELGPHPYLVRSTEFDYDDHVAAPGSGVRDALAHQGSTPFGSFIRRITQSGYLEEDPSTAITRNGVVFRTYLTQSLPPIEVEYSRPEVDETVRHVEDLPQGVDGARVVWADLDGEGLPGLLTEQGHAWFYSRNRGGAFAAPAPVDPMPAARLSAGAQLLDLAGDGHLDVVQLQPGAAGFYERSALDAWAPFRAFVSLPSTGVSDPNSRFIDLDGDGHADVLITEDDALAWHPSLAEAGFGPARRVPMAPDDERGPRLVFNDGTQSIYLADMSGDGLTDLVRIRNGAVCYWPNLGYGRFGAKVAMDRSPLFETPDLFDQDRIRLADIDGSGVTDIIYLGRNRVSLYFNESGNGWSAAHVLMTFPAVDNVAAVSTADLLGNGTICLVWSSPLPRDAERPMRFIDLMSGRKPHLLVRVANNLGAETRVHYTSSTAFYLKDRAEGRPWITRLAFPVHVVERTERYDHVAGTKLVTRFAYHHGYFDSVERELRGFALLARR